MPNLNLEFPQFAGSPLGTAMCKKHCHILNRDSQAFAQQMNFKMARLREN